MLNNDDKDVRELARSSLVLDLRRHNHVSHSFLKNTALSEDINEECREVFVLEVAYTPLTLVWRKPL